MTFGEVLGLLVGFAVLYFAGRYVYRTLKAKYSAPKAGSSGSGGGGKDRHPDAK